MYFHSLGIPQEDFDPLVADTFKTFYYSPFLVISFIFILSKLLDNINRQTIVITIIFIFSTLHINGFPKKDSSEYYGFLDELNQNNVLCEINSLIIFDIKNSSKCTNKVDELCKFYTNKEEFELETSKFLIVDNVSYVKDEFQTVNQCINKINRVSQLETARLPIYTLSIFFMFILINLYTVLRPNNFPSRIWLSNN